MSSGDLYSLENGSLFWVRSNRKSIKVPLEILTEQQRSALKELLLSGNFNPVPKRACLVWEYWYQTDGGSYVDVIELNKEQKEKVSPSKPRQKFEHSFGTFDFELLRSKIVGGETDWKEVRSIFESMRYCPWYSKKWREARDGKIERECSTCGSSDGPMVLQHTRQPRKFATVFKDFERSHALQFREWLVAHPIPSPDLSGFEKSADACPQCGSQVLRHRKRTNDWVCVGVIAKVACGHQFSKSIKQVPSQVISELEKSALQSAKEKFFDESGIGRQIALATVDDMILYLSMEHTKTLCKKCAFKEDRLAYRKRWS